jgi:hypothetical protein
VIWNEITARRARLEEETQRPSASRSFKGRLAAAAASPKTYKTVLRWIVQI